MNVLAQIVPAVREVRAPLIGGFLWLLAGWLIVGDGVPAEGDLAPGSLWALLHRAAGLIGAAAGVVALSVAAYLIGSLVGEPIEWAMRRAWGDMDRLAELAETVPQTKALVETALRVHAEAQLRFHVALPLVPIGITVADRAPPASAAVFAAAVAMGLHGAGLALRAWRKGEMAQSLAKAARSALSLEERRLRSAQIDITTKKHHGSRGVDQFLVFQNSGNAPARGVTLEPATESDSLHFVLSGTLPIEEVGAGEQVEVPIAVAMGDPPAVKVRVRWLDETGEREYERSLRLM